ncbi:hypothetical protein Trydic_g12980 [Trypoxylus dichotomus]
MVNSHTNGVDYSGRNPLRVATLYGMAHSTNQTDGVVMGSPLSPVVANLFMERCENLAVETAVAFGHREEINWTGFLNI